MMDEDHVRSMNKALATEETTEQYLKDYGLLPGTKTIWT